MRPLAHIKREKQVATDTLLKECNVFFWAFSDEQFAKNKTPLADGEKYVSIGGGGYLPKSKVDQLRNGFKEIDNAFKKAVADNKQREEHILYELQNHEAFYTCDIEDTLATLGSDFTYEEVMHIYKKNKEKELECRG